MKPFRAQRGAKIFDFRFTFLRKLKHFRAQRGAKFFDFSSIRAKNNFELTFHNSFIAHHAPGIINNFFHYGLPAGRINYYNEKVQAVKYVNLENIHHQQHHEYVLNAKLDCILLIIKQIM